VLISLLVAFTLTPLAGSKLMKKVELGRGPWGAFSRAFDRGFDWTSARYVKILGWSLNHRWLPPLLMFAALAIVVQLPGLGIIKNEFLPDLDDGAIRVNVELPPGSSLDATDRSLRAIEANIKDIPEIEHMIAISGTEKDSNDRDWSTAGTSRYGIITVSLVDVRERQRSTKAVAQDIRERLPLVPDAQLRVGTGKPGVPPVEVRIRGGDDAVVYQLSERVLNIVRNTPGAVDARTSQAPGSPEARLAPDRLRGPDSGVTADVAAAALRTTLEGSVASKWRAPGERELDVRLIGDPALTDDPRALNIVPVGGMLNGKPVTVSLNQVTTREDTTGPSALDRYDRVRSIYIRANLAYGVYLSEVIGPITLEFEKMRAEGIVPTGYTVDFGGSTEQQEKNFAQIKFAFGLAIILVYMVLASLFESLILPFTVLFTVPSALIGALTGLALTGQTLNLLSLIGLVVLIALVGDNGSMLVEYTQDLRREGLERRAALMKAGPVRMRPIIMTSLGTIVGTLPLALGTQPGSEMYQSLGVEMVFGLGLSVFMTLIIIPCMYSYFDDLQHLIGRVFKWRPGRQQGEPPEAQAGTPVTVDGRRHGLDRLVKWRPGRQPAEQPPAAPA
jgi:hydrophobic/amphiphilic exporter-1 (mainly G- bacteria), HAE1 family